MILAILLAVGGAVPVFDLPARFSSLLERDDLAAVMAAAPAGDVENDELFDIRVTVAKYDCIDVHALSAYVESLAEDAVTFRVEVVASGTTIGAIRQERMLPPVWFVTFVREGDAWRMKKARTREGELVARILAVADEGARWDILRGEDFDAAILSLRLNFRIDEDTSVWPFARQLAAATGDRDLESNAFIFAASASLREPACAAEYVREARRLAAESGDRTSMVSVEFTEGVVSWFAGDVDGALRSFALSGSSADSISDPRTALQALYMMAHLEWGRGNVIAAASHAQRAAERAHRYGWEDGELNALANMAVIHWYLGNEAEALAVNREALRRATAVGRKASIGAALYNIAEAEEAAGNYAEAEALLLRAAAVWVDAKDRLSGRMGQLLVRQERYEEAEPHFRRALASARRISDGNEEIGVLVELSGLALRRGKPEEALALVREARAANPAVRVSQLAAPWVLHAAEGEALAALGRSREAVAAFETAAGLVELEKSIASGEASPRFLADRLEPFLALMRLRVAEGSKVEALRVSERMKARVLHDLLARGQVDLHEVLTDEERTEEEALNARLVDLNRAVIAAGDDATAELRDSLEQARVRQRAFAVRMQLAHPELRNTAATPAAAEIGEWLASGTLVTSPDSVVLDYVAGERETTLVALTRGDGGATDVRIFTLPVTKKELALGVHRLVSQLERRELGYGEAAEELYRRLLAPAASVLAGKSNICIIPHGTLWQLPFAVLRGPDGKHLIERASIHYSPSLAYLALHAGRSRNWLPDQPRVLALGNPAIADASRARVRAWTRDTLGTLPEAAAEARAVGELYGGTDVLVRGAATEEAVKAQAATQDILHFATHGISQATQPMYSSLVLATDSEREDGLLEAREIVRMDLRAQLAVLSACETARGDVIEGEGVVGLSWAFLVAGCPRTVVTQWRADSAAAAKAMTGFHRRLARTEGGGSIAAALREAQLALLRTPRYSHPYYWGGFVVVGAGW